MNLHRRRREINGSSPSWRIKKKKILWSLSCSRDSRIHLRCRCIFLASLGGLDTGKPPPSRREDPGGRATAASHSPRRGRRAVPGARGGPAAGGPPPGPSPPRPGPSGPRFHPGTYKASLRASKGPRRTEQGEKGPHPRAGECPLPQPHRTGTGNAGEPGRRPRQSAQPRRGGVPGPPALRPPGSRILGAGRPAHLPARPSRWPGSARRRPPGRPRSGSGPRATAGSHRNALEDAPGCGCPYVFGVAVADNGGLLAAAIAHQVIHVALPTGHLRALRTAAGTARSSRRSGGGGGGRGRRRRRRRGWRRGGGGEEAALRRHRPPPSPRSCGGRTLGRW